jgi:hypothetical protein
MLAYASATASRAPIVNVTSSAVPVRISHAGPRSLYEVAISPVGVLKCPITRIRTAENRHLNPSVIVFPFDAPARAPAFAAPGAAARRRARCGARCRARPARDRAAARGRSPLSRMRAAVKRSLVQGPGAARGRSGGGARGGAGGSGGGYSGEGPRRVGGPLAAPDREADLQGNCGGRPGWVVSRRSRSRSRAARICGANPVAVASVG